MQRGTAPNRHLFVCVNRRSEWDPLGSGCGDRGEALYASLKACVAQRGLVRDVWVTRTLCLGLCPRRGGALASYPEGLLLSEVDEQAVETLCERSPGESVDELVENMVGLQKEKVFALARRLLPHITSEDLQNPHDFPSLSDPDFHYEDGVRAGLESVQMALRARKKP